MNGLAEENQPGAFFPPSALLPCRSAKMEPGRRAEVLTQRTATVHGGGWIGTARTREAHE
jgi:hypothetical protein